MVEWRFEVDCNAGTDYETGEHIAYWDWTIFDGPIDPDDVVLCGQTDLGDPTDVVAHVVELHNQHAVTPVQ